MPEEIKLVAKVMIELLSNGQIKVTAPLSNPKACMAMLDEAAKVIQKLIPESEAEEQGKLKVTIVERKLILPN